MRLVRQLAVCTLFAATCIVCAAAEQATPLRLMLLGDSTVCDYPAESATRGWGQYIADCFKKSVQVRNVAVSGRSTKTFIKEGRLKKALEEKVDFVLIQFGHNDSHGAGKPESTDAATDYRDFLRTYIDSFRQNGAKPILVTPMHRRTFSKGKLTEELRPYAEAMKTVAGEKNVPVIDLYASSGELFEKLGEEKSVDLNCSAKDRTHFSEKGARAMAGLVFNELIKLDPRLADAAK